MAQHDSGNRHCLTDPCPWHPGEQRATPALYWPAQLETTVTPLRWERVMSGEHVGHGVMCDGCLIVGILDLVKKYERLAKTDSARYSRAKDVVVDLRGLLPTRPIASAEDSQ